MVLLIDDDKILIRFCHHLDKILSSSISNTIHFKAYQLVILDYSLVFRVTYTRSRIDTINSPDDGHIAV